MTVPKNRKIEAIKSHILPMVKFGIVGVSNTVIDFVVFYLLSFVILEYLAKGISFAVSVVNSFVWNRWWTFQKKGRATKMEMVKFLAVNLLTLGINLVFYWIWRDLLQLNKVWSFILTAPFVTLTNYILNRFWVFTKEQEA